MKEKKFTKEELKLLEKVIESRLKYYEENLFFFKNSRRLKNRKKQLESLLFHLKDYSGQLFVNESDINLLGDCLKENKYSLREKLPEKSDLLFDWIDLSEKESEIMNKLDVNSGILLKLRPIKMKNIHFYRDKISIIDKIKRSEIILLAKTGENNFYKIGFVHQNEESLVFELRHDISFSNITHYKSIDFKEFTANFSLETDRKSAREIFSEYKNQGMSNESLRTIQLLLE